MNEQMESFFTNCLYFILVFPSPCPSIPPSQCILLLPLLLLDVLLLPYHYLFVTIAINAISHCQEGGIVGSATKKYVLSSI